MNRALPWNILPSVLTAHIADIILLSAMLLYGQTSSPKYHSTCCYPLPPDKVSKLPRQIRTQLAEERCLIPQNPNVLDDPQPNNALRGPWATPAQQDWSVLCLKPLELSIRVFWVAKTACPDTVVLAKFRPNDGHWEDPEMFLWAADPGKIRAYNQAFGRRKLPPLDHSGLEVGGEEASTIYYCYEGKWLTFSGND
jgi:hypothetical protein